jgi:hypothetical protein
MVNEKEQNKYLILHIENVIWKLKILNSGKNTKKESILK